mgnify:CR=1 FL=1
MDVNSINPILQAFAEILPQIGFQEITKKGIALEGATLENPGILINIGVMGPLKGAILIGMSIDDAQQFASKMMMGMPVSDLDELAQSALAEMGNMVCANACSLFSQAGTVGLDISPPSLLVGKGAHVRVSVSQMVVVNFSADGIAVDIYAGLF